MTIKGLGPNGLCQARPELWLNISWEYDVYEVKLLSEWICGYDISIKNSIDIIATMENNW